MNQRPPGLLLSKALTGFLQYKGAEGIASRTVDGYRRDLNHWIEYQGDGDILKVEPKHILTFLNYMRTDYVPRRITGGNSRKLTPKTIYNIYISLASFFTWASHEFNLVSPMKMWLQSWWMSMRKARGSAVSLARSLPCSSITSPHA